MDKFVNQWRKQKQHDPAASNRLNDPKMVKKRNKISNYFSAINQQQNEISIDCSDDDHEDHDLKIEDDEDDDIQVLNDRRRMTAKRRKQSQQKKQKSLTQFLRSTNRSLDGTTIDLQTQRQHAQWQHQFVPPLLNQRHLLELSELSGVRNIGSAQRLRNLHTRTTSNLNWDALNRRHFHLSMTNQHLHRLPLFHSMHNNPVQSLRSNAMDYISSVQFDAMGSLLCVASTNGIVGIFDFDRFLTKWNHAARVRYNQCIVNLRRENAAKRAVGEDDITEIDDFVARSRATMANVLEISIDAQFRIEAVQWSQNMNDIAVCGHGGGCLNIYDLRRSNNKPKFKLRSASKRNQPLLIAKYAPHRPSLIVAGDRMGCVWGWDLRATKSGRPSLTFDAVSRPSTLTGNIWSTSSSSRSSSNLNLNNFAVKTLHLHDDGMMMYVVRENGFIELMDLRKPGTKYKTIDLWRCPLDDGSLESKRKHKDSFYAQSVHANTSTAHRARIDDAVINESMNTVLLKLQNNSLVNVSLERETIRKTFRCEEELPPPTLDEAGGVLEEQAVDVSFLGQMQQRRMCSFARYAMPEMVVTGSFRKDMWTVDMAPELDAYYLEQERRRSEVATGQFKLKSKSLSVDLCEGDSRGSVEQGDESQNGMRDGLGTDALHSKSYGLMGKTKLCDVMTSCSVHPKSLYIACGTLGNALEIVACASNPL